MIEIVYVILHFLTINDTIEAIESIESKSVSGTYKIVVVDNGSNNGTGIKLQAQYIEDENVNVIISDKNLGFAKGNNLGFRYALQHYKPVFIVLLNNDIIMMQDNFLETIKKEYEQSRFAVLGPMIITADGAISSSPVINAPITEKAILNNYRKEKKLLLIEFLHLNWLREISLKLKIHNNFFKYNSDRDYYTNRHENVVLHGCCLIFSPQYYTLFEKGLDESTFLYHEEEILFLETRSKGLKLVYNPELNIYHKEDAASNALSGNNRNKRIFKLRNCLNSSKELIRIYGETINNGRK